MVGLQHGAYLQGTCPRNYYTESADQHLLSYGKNHTDMLFLRLKCRGETGFFCEQPQMVSAGQEGQLSEKIWCMASFLQIFKTFAIH
jgi:hypothetical protein